MDEEAKHILWHMSDRELCDVLERGRLQLPPLLLDRAARLRASVVARERGDAGATPARPTDRTEAA